MGQVGTHFAHVVCVMIRSSRSQCSSSKRLSCMFSLKMRLCICLCQSFMDTSSRYETICTSLRSCNLSCMSTPSMFASFRCFFRLSGSGGSDMLRAWPASLQGLFSSYLGWRRRVVAARTNKRHHHHHSAGPPCDPTRTCFGSSPRRLLLAGAIGPKSGWRVFQ